MKAAVFLDVLYNMFCPTCGNPDQKADSYCRRCGVLLPDLTKTSKPKNTPEQHVIVNTVLSTMTIAACFTFAILLWVMLGFRENTHPLIYVTASMLLAMGIWHIQALWRILQLKKHIRKFSRRNEALPDAGETDKLLGKADLDGFVPASVTEYTTKHLTERKDKLP